MTNTMKKLLCNIAPIMLLSLLGCSPSGNGELVGVPGRKGYTETTPYGMVLIPQGSYTMGSNDQDVVWAINAPSKTVTIASFWMDQTEITNNEYRQFVYYVRDSIARSKLAEVNDEFAFTEDEYGNILEPPILNWEVPIDMEDEEQREALESMFYQGDERFYGRKELDTTK